MLAEIDLPGAWDREMLALAKSGAFADDNMTAIRILTGLAVLSRDFFHLSINEQDALIQRLKSDCEANANLNELMGTAFELQVYSRLARAGMAPEFIRPRKKRKSPDILVPGYQLLIECKNLSPKDLRKTHINRMCVDMRQHTNNARLQFGGYDERGDFRNLVVFHLPSDPRGFFTGKEMGERVNVFLAASGSADSGYLGTPGPTAVLLVESSLSRLYDRPAPLREPMEYWHVPGPPLGDDPTLSRFTWQLFMSMKVCPFEGFSKPMLAMNNFLYGQSAPDLRAMEPELAISYWRAWNERTGNRFSEFEIPPLPCFPSM